MLPLETEPITRRSGPGWSMVILPTTLTVILTEGDEEAGIRAIEDLRTWGNPADWTLVASGWSDNGAAYFLYEWEQQ